VQTGRPYLAQQLGGSEQTFLSDALFQYREQLTLKGTVMLRSPAT
jgi:hypothetical protein